MGKSSGENSNTHTHFYTHIQTHLYTHIPVCTSIPLNEAASLASTLQLLPPLFACLVLHSSSLPHTHTHTHIVCPAKRSDYPMPFCTVPLLLLGHTTPLDCRALKSINSFWSCTNRDSLRFLSLFLPLTLPLSLSTYFYFLCAYFALFTASLRPLPPSPWLTFLWHKSF